MTSNVTGANVLAEARRWIGTPYVHQGCTRGAGCDCLGLIRGIWLAILGNPPAELPAHTADWGEVSANEYVLDTAARLMPAIRFDTAAPGDLLVFCWRRRTVAKHLGILSDNNRFIHAHEGVGVTETTLGPHWSARVAAVFRFPDPRQD